MTPDNWRPFTRKPGRVLAQQQSTVGVIYTPAGIFHHYPGDWIVEAGDRTWVVEADKFNELYEADEGLGQ